MRAPATREGLEKELEAVRGRHGPDNYVSVWEGIIYSTWYNSFWHYCWDGEDNWNRLFKGDSHCIRCGEEIPENVILMINLYETRTYKEYEERTNGKSINT